MTGHIQPYFSEQDREKGGAADRIRDLIAANASDRDLSAALLRALRDGPDEGVLRLVPELAERTLSCENLTADSSRLLDILLKVPLGAGGDGAPDRAARQRDSRGDRAAAPGRGPRPA